MSGPQLVRARIFWFELANKWAIRTPLLSDAQKERQFALALRRACDAAFHHGLQGWVVSEDQLDAAREIVAQYHPRYEFVARPRPQRPQHAPRPPVRRTEVPAYETFCILVEWQGSERLSRASARALYRRAARRLHPDAGGPPDAMASLNAAWRAIRDTLG